MNILRLALFSCTVPLAGCVTPITSRDLTPAVAAARHHSQSVTVIARATTPEGERFLDYHDRTLQDAVTESLARSGVFRQVTASGPADCQLEVSLLSVSWPATGLSMSSSAAMSWKLTRTATRTADARVFFQTNLVTEFSEDALAAGVGATRSHEVMRGAVCRNIQEGIEALGRADY